MTGHPVTLVVIAADVPVDLIDLQHCAKHCHRDQAGGEAPQRG